MLPLGGGAARPGGGGRCGVVKTMVLLACILTRPRITSPSRRARKKTKVAMLGMYKLTCPHARGSLPVFSSCYATACAFLLCTTDQDTHIFIHPCEGVQPPSTKSTYRQTVETARQDTAHKCSLVFTYSFLFWSLGPHIKKYCTVSPTDLIIIDAGLAGRTAFVSWPWQKHHRNAAC